MQVLSKTQSTKIGKGPGHILRTCSHPGLGLLSPCAPALTWLPSRYLAELCGIGTCGEPRAAFPTVSCAFLLCWPAGLREREPG